MEYLYLVLAFIAGGIMGFMYAIHRTLDKTSTVTSHMITWIVDYVQAYPNTKLPAGELVKLYIIDMKKKKRSK